MLKNYLKIAIRNLLKQRGYTFINIFGLAIGMACCILIFLLIRYEWSYDTFHEKKDSIYSLFIQEKRTDGTLKFRRLIPLGIPKALAKEFPGVSGVVQLASGDVTMVHQGQAFREEIFEADPTFFNIFSLPLLVGDPNSALRHPTNMVVSETIAQKYFGDMSDGYQHVPGKTLSIRIGDSLEDFTISGVMANCPDNSSLQIDILIPFENYADLPLGSNDVDGRTSTYVLLDEREHSFALEQALRPFTALHFKNRIETYQARGLLAAGDDAFQLRLQPLSELHRNPQVPISYEEPAHNPMYSYILAGIGILVLLIACINFTTLSVARSASRAREVGMRKAVGAQKQQLMAQFWGEALMLSFFALLLGLAITAQSLPFFNYLTGKKLSLTGIQHGEVWLVLLGLMLIVGFITGTYPAVILSRFQPAIVLKGNMKTGGASLLTRSLVGIQFTLSIVLMLCASIMGEQVEFLKRKDLGYKNDMVVVIRNRNGSSETVEKYRNALTGYANVTYVVGAGQAFSRSEDTRLWSDAGGATRIAHVYGVDYDYVDMMEMTMIAGRNFSRAFPADPKNGVLVNEALVHEFGLEDPVGQKLHGFMPNLFADAPLILGVVKDFNFKSLHEKVKPAVLTLHPNYWARFRNIFVKLNPDNISATLKMLKEKWSVAAPDNPFEIFFLDEDVQKQYLDEERWRSIVRYSTIVALMIACMGVFGLAALLVTKRTKEIGIRKVFGASVSSVVLLLSKDFMRLVLIAFLLAAPLGYFIMNLWLQDFAYRVAFGVRTFLFVGGLALCIVILTVSYQSIKTALANPVDSLRYE